MQPADTGADGNHPIYSALLVAAEPEIVEIAIGGGELAGDLHADACARAMMAITQRSR